MKGSSASEADRNSDEGPQRQVMITKPFLVAKFEVTFAAWDACVSDRACLIKPSDNGWGRGRRPVINVSWDDTQYFIAWLQKKTGQYYRLLTEAEWEYAARAGSTTAFSTGPTITTDQANFNGDYTYGGSRKGQLREKTMEVGSFLANPWGLHDIHGNVSEWVDTCYVASYAFAPLDAKPVFDEASCRGVVRGGSWADPPQRLRSAYRAWSTTDFWEDVVGFRIARSL